jgi:uncharacterized membrane protein YgdD (TMEM256/DUF423 family)
MRLWLFVAGLDGALAVIMAAVGAHGPGLSDRAARAFDSANEIHIWHALALLGIALLAGRSHPTAAFSLMVRIAGILFLAGTVLFSGTLYIQSLAGTTPLPLAAPAGGTALILGWLALAGAALPGNR